MSRTLAGVLVGLLALMFAGAASAGIPDPDLSFVTLGPDAGMATCPSGDGPAFQYITVTAKRDNGTPISGIPYTSFFFTVTGGDVTITHVDPETSALGEIRFEMVGDETIIGQPGVTVEATIYTVVLSDSDDLDCNSFDMNNDGGVGLQDFAMFSAAYGSTEWTADFNFDGTVGLQDFAMFSAHYGH